MANITLVDGHVLGASKCGRIEYSTANSATGTVKIDGRWAAQGRYPGAPSHQGHYLDVEPGTGWVARSMVEPADWQTALKLIADVDTAKAVHTAQMCDAAEAVADARADAMDGIEKVRGGAYDRNTW